MAPKKAVSLVINNSIPLSFTTPNNLSFEPPKICPESLALLICNNTNTINKNETIKSIVYNIENPPNTN